MSESDEIVKIKDELKDKIKKMNLAFLRRKFSIQSLRQRVLLVDETN